MSFQFPLRPRAEFLCETRGLLAIFAKCHKVSCLRKIDIFDKADKACCIPGTETGGLHRVLFFYPLKLAKRSVRLRYWRSYLDWRETLPQAGCIGCIDSFESSFGLHCRYL